MSRQKPTLRDLPVDQLQRGAYQPRRVFQADELQELAQSILSTGLIQPVVVRPLISDNLNNTEPRYEILAGERRWRASQLAQLPTVSCLIQVCDNAEAAAISTVENINRVDLTPIEVAGAYQRMIDDFNYSHEALAAVIGKSRSKITNALRLLKLDPFVQNLLSEQTLSEGHGKIIAGLPSRQQRAFAEQCVKQAWSVQQAGFKVKTYLLQPNQGNQGNQSNQRNNAKDPDLTALSQAIGDHIGCSVAVELDEKGCELRIRCHNLDIFQGVLDKWGFKFPS